MTVTHGQLKFPWKPDTTKKQ